MRPEELRHIRGNKIAMIFQEPMTSLNPVLPIGEQIAESVRLHLGYSPEKALDRAAYLLERVGIPKAKSRNQEEKPKRPTICANSARTTTRRPAA